MMNFCGSGIERALIAKGVGGGETILATDGPWIADDVENISDDNNDVGLCDMSKLPAGLYLFTGNCKVVCSGLEEEPYNGWRGEVRSVTLEELPALLAMKPPEEVHDDRMACVECGELTSSCDADGTPYCENHRSRRQ